MENMILKPINYEEIPNKFLEEFKPKKETNFIEDVFDKQIRDRIQQFDQTYRVTINKDVTKDFNKWLNDKRKIKKNISVNIMGQTRSGKSLIGLKIADNNTRFYNYDFDTELIVCGNQREFRQKLSKAKFGQTFQIDENAFSNVGEGSNAETQQLKDIQNIIAKMNINTIYITPRTFLDTGASMGLEFHSTDNENWLSKFMLFSLKVNPVLMGYIIIDVGKIFNDYGCFFNKYFGGCTNPNKKILKGITKDNLIFDNVQDKDNIKEETISIDYLKYSQCISDKFKTDINKINKSLTDDDKTKISCPFYRVCKSPMCGYEHKKDKWIDREMKGGLNERTFERYRIVLELIIRCGLYDEDKDGFVLDVNNAKQIKPLVDLHLPEITSTKLTITETKEIILSLQSMENKAIFFKMVESLEFNLKDTLKKIKGTENLNI